MVWYGSYGLIALHSHCGGLDDLAPTWECRLKVLDQSAAFNEAACKVVGLQRLSPCIAQARIEGVWQWQIPAVASLHRAEIANGGLDLLAALVVDAEIERERRRGVASLDRALRLLGRSRDLPVIEVAE